MTITIESHTPIAAARSASLDSASADSELRSLAYVCAATALGGTFWNVRWAWQATDQSFVQALVCFACLLFGLLVRPSPRVENFCARAKPLLLIAAFTYFFSILLRARPNVAPYVHLMLAAALLIGLGLGGVRRFERWRVPLLLAVFVALGVWRILTAPAPQIDVWVWHQEAIAALFRGENPYAITMPNVFPDARYYDPSMVVNGRVLTGYQYPPLSLYFAIPGYLLGDYRYSMLLAIGLAGAALAYTRPSPLAAAASALWLFSPGALFILQYGYTESMIVMLVTLTVCCAEHRPRWLYVPLGLLLASKQYVFAMVAPLVWLLPRHAGARPVAGLLLRATLVAIGVTLPFFVINPKAFFDCMVVLQLRQPFRPESLSVLGYWATHFGEQLPTWWCFASLVPSCAFALWRCERSSAGFASGLALVSFVFFFFSKQAFANYYFLSLGCLCCAIAHLTCSQWLLPRPDSRSGGR